MFEQAATALEVHRGVGLQLDGVVVVDLAVPAVGNVREANLEPLRTRGPERPVRRVLEEEVLDQHVLAVWHVEEEGAVLAANEVPDSGEAPPNRTVAVERALEEGGGGLIPLAKGASGGQQTQEKKGARTFPDDVKVTFLGESKNRHGATAPDSSAGQVSILSVKTRVP